MVVAARVLEEMYASRSERCSGLSARALEIALNEYKPIRVWAHVFLTSKSGDG